MRSRSVPALWLVAGAVLAVAGTPTALGVNGVILDQQLSASHKGHTVLQLWGSDYEMGYAQAALLGDYIVVAIEETKTFLGGNYNTARGIVAVAVWAPPGTEDEFHGMVDCLAVTHPSANIDELDLKVANAAGDWLYACRSHTCWGRYVADPVKTLATRRLDFPTLYSSMNHHVLCGRDPTDGSPRWVNMGWPGSVTAATGVNQFGTLVSLHDYNSAHADLTAGRMPRVVACRYALTFVTDPDVPTHLTRMYAELQQYQIMTGSFVNYYAPEGCGGVMVCNPYQSGPDFYYLRVPQTVWHHGEAMITTNAWTDGTYTPLDENFGADTYYNDETPKTQASHWGLLATIGSLHQFSVAYRGHADMTIWADGKTGSASRTPRLEWEWAELFSLGDLNCDGAFDGADIEPFFVALADPAEYAVRFPGCNIKRADMNSDGAVDGADIEPFFDALAG